MIAGRRRLALAFAFGCVVGACKGSPKPKTYTVDKPARTQPVVVTKPRHPSHEHAHGPHPHPSSDHHHHPHPHPHLAGLDGHHHPY